MINNFTLIKLIKWLPFTLRMSPTSSSFDPLCLLPFLNMPYPFWLQGLCTYYSLCLKFFPQLLSWLAHSSSLTINATSLKKVSLITRYVTACLNYYNLVYLFYHWSQSVIYFYISLYLFIDPSFQLECNLHEGGDCGYSAVSLISSIIQAHTGQTE